MRRRSLPLSLLVLILVAGIYGPRTTATASVAQGASPEARFPITPAAAECTVEPRAVESLVALLGTPVANGAPDRGEQAAEPSLVEVPVGQAADEEIEAGIIATVVEYTACFNVGDTARTFALFTDAFLQGYVEENALTAEDIAFLTAEPEPVLVEAQSTILAVTDITTLADGRAGAFVVTTSPWSGPDTAFMFFAYHGKRWLVDEVIEFIEE